MKDGDAKSKQYSASCFAWPGLGLPYASCSLELVFPRLWSGDGTLNKVKSVANHPEIPYLICNAAKG